MDPTGLPPHASYASPSSKLDAGKLDRFQSFKALLDGNAKNVFHAIHVSLFSSGNDRVAAVQNKLDKNFSEAFTTKLDAMVNKLGDARVFSVKTYDGMIAAAAYDAAGLVCEQIGAELWQVLDLKSDPNSESALADWSNDADNKRIIGKKLAGVIGQLNEINVIKQRRDDIEYDSMCVRWGRSANDEIARVTNWCRQHKNELDPGRDFKNIEGVIGVHEDQYGELLKNEKGDVLRVIESARALAHGKQGAIIKAAHVQLTPRGFALLSALLGTHGIGIKIVNLKTMAEDGFQTVHFQHVPRGMRTPKTEA